MRKTIWLHFAATKSANNIQQVAITAANPITKPINNHPLAPRAPKHPPLYASPRI